MKTACLTALYCCLGGLTRAQTSNGVYAAPGMPIYPQSQGTVSKSTVSKHAPANVLKTGPLISPRFWKLRDSAYVKAATPFYRYVSSHFVWPNTTTRAGIEGQIFIRLFVLPDGSVIKSEVVGRKLNQMEGFSEEKISQERIKAGKDALDVYAEKFAKTLRFETSATTDSIGVV